MLIEGSESLFIEEVTGPGPVSAGADVVLHCKFDLEDDVLYAVKWFRFGREFYRFEPQRRPQIQIFPLDNVNVDVRILLKKTIFQKVPEHRQESFKIDDIPRWH